MTTKQEQWQLDILLGLNRLLEVLHDISDTTHATHLLIQEQERDAKSPPVVDDDGDRLLTVEETAEFLGIGRTQIYGTFRQVGPKPIKIGKRTMYRKADLKAWLDSKRDLRIDTYRDTPTRVHDPRPLPTAHRPYKERPTCPGSGTEPVSVTKYGDGECRVCHWKYQRRSNGTLFKHKTPDLYF